MPGYPELAKELLKKSIDSIEGQIKIGAKGNLATLLKKEGKWQESRAIYHECVDYFRRIMTNTALLYLQVSRHRFTKTGENKGKH